MLTTTMATKRPSDNNRSLLYLSLYLCPCEMSLCLREAVSQWQSVHREKIMHIFTGILRSCVKRQDGLWHR